MITQMQYYHLLLGATHPMCGHHMYMPSKLGKGDIKPSLLPFPHISALLFLLLVCGVCLDLYRPEGRSEIEHTHASSLLLRTIHEFIWPIINSFFPVAQREEVSHRRLRLRPPLVRVEEERAPGKGKKGSLELRRREAQGSVMSSALTVCT